MSSIALWMIGAWLRIFDGASIAWRPGCIQSRIILESIGWMGQEDGLLLHHYDTKIVLKQSEQTYIAFGFTCCAVLSALFLLFSFFPFILCTSQNCHVFLIFAFPQLIRWTGREL